MTLFSSARTFEVRALCDGMALDEQWFVGRRTKREEYAKGFGRVFVW